ncbi:O-antigen ligase family protein [Mammaliicoccus sp. P-M57]|uniref:O-antigen ligase family protein n=1 Tax=Mammaliicoccus sp. P-M57 TaxID=2898716 RepID=UPI001EFB68A8|nr:O-antigen ligase family protein [Mammaliicoccus sp. P-M57]
MNRKPYLTLSRIETIFLFVVFTLLYIATLNATGNSTIGKLSLWIVIVLTNILFIIKHIVNKKIDKIYLLFILYIIGFIVSALITIQLNVFEIGINNIVQLCACMGIFFYFSSLEWSNEKIKSAWIASFIFALIHFIIWLGQGLPSQFKSFYPNSNLVGAYMFVVIFFFILRFKITKTSKLLKCTIIIPLLLLWASDTRSILLSLLISFMVYVIYPFLRKSKFIGTILFLIFTIIMLSIVFVYPALPRWKYFDVLENWMLENMGKSLMSGRSEIWTNITYFIYQKPFFGYGPDKVASDFIGMKASTHNLYLNIVLQVGIIGLIIFFLILYTIFIKSYVQNTQYSRIAISFFIGILIHQLFEITLIQNQLSVGIFQWIIIALCLSKIKKSERLHNSP